MSWPRWYRWRIVIIGLESGNRTPLPFVRFRDEYQAQTWVARMNQAHSALSGLTEYGYEPIPR